MATRSSSAGSRAGPRAGVHRAGSAEKKSFFFYDTETGAFKGRWTLPRDESNMENRTLYSYNVVPLRNGRDVLVSGNYQAGAVGRRLHRPRQRGDR